MSLASYWSSGDRRVEQASAVGSPDEVTQIGRSGCLYSAVSLRGRSTIEPRVNASLIVVDRKSFQFALQVQTIPEEDLIEVLTSHGADEPLDEWVRARHEGDGLEFLDLKDPQVRSPAMESEQRVMIGTQVSWETLLAAGAIEHPADSNAVNMRGLNTESHDSTREDIYDEHYPEALQRDGLTSEKIDTPQAVAGLCDQREPRGPLSSGLRTVMFGQNPAHYVLVNLGTERM